MMRRTLPFLLLLLAACAQVRELQGGPQDKEAPVLLAAEPPNGTVRFNSDRILLRFNERVKLDRVRERLLISPPLDKAPEVTITAGTDVMIRLTAPLAPATTYTFNIGEAVVDISEGNPAAGLTYVVSTGDVLDSLSIMGRVVDAFTDKPEAGVLVVLHTDTDSTGFERGRPAYFSRTDAQGNFRLPNLRGGAYRLGGLQDQNANYRFDLPNERVAFLEPLVDPLDSIHHVLRMFLQPPAVQLVKEAAVQPDRCWRLVLARPADRLELTSIDRVGDNLVWTPEWNITRDTVLFWPSDTTLLVDQRFTVRDSSGILDTLTYRVFRKMPFLVNAKIIGSLPDGTQRVMATRPLERVDAGRSALLIDSLEFPVDPAIDTAWPRLLAFTEPRLKYADGTLVLLPGALRDIYGGENDTIRIAVGMPAAAQTGDLHVNLAMDSGTAGPGPFILQLLNGQGGVVRSAPVPSLPGRVDLPGVPAGVYTLKLIADADADGRWTTGWYTIRRQPERVFRLSDEVNVRAGWDVGLDWTIKDR